MLEGLWILGSDQFSCDQSICKITANRLKLPLDVKILPPLRDGPMCILNVLVHDFSQMVMCYQAKFQSNMSRMVMSWNEMVMQGPKNRIVSQKTTP